MNTFAKPLLSLLVSAVSVASFGQAQWQNTLGENKSFIENFGQFEIMPIDDFDSQVHYSYDGESEDYFFTSSGVVYRFNEKSIHERTPEEKAQRKNRKMEGFSGLPDWQLFERSGKKMDYRQDRLIGQWVGANTDVQIVPLDETPYYHSYSIYPESNSLKMKNINHIPSFGKLVYRELYDHIDVIYEFHEKTGVKYTVIARPGADLSEVKLRYNKEIQLQPDGSIRIETDFGTVIDHAPVSFYQEQEGEIIPSAYSVDGRTISFSVPGYDHKSTLIIDPWTQTPAFNTNWDCVWECETDALGNAYIIGGTMPLQLLKYNAAGALQWTYNTPYDTTMWLGTFATDDAGNSYVTNGSTAQIQMINTTGTMVWDNPSPGGLFTSTEFWNIAFNCDQTKLVIAGTGGSVPPLPYIYDVDMSTGNVISSIQVTGSSLSPVQEVRAITATENEKYYWLSHDSIGYVSQNLTLCPNQGGTPFHVDNGYGLGYKCENWRYNNTGIEAIAYYDGYVYVHRGDQLDKRDFYTANVVQSVAIPGGVFTSVFLGGNQVECSGIDIDDCGNIYVGATNGVVAFDQNLNQIGTYATSFNVYDVDVSTAGDIIAAGSTGDSNDNTRSGGVQSFAAGACAQLATVCCNPSVCPEGPLCTTDSPVTFQTETPGGTWSSGPGFNASTGTFDPAAAGPGTYTFYYTIACGMDSVTVTVGVCDPLEICVETNGDLTISGGNPGYTWQEGTLVASCVSGFSSFCGFFTDPGPMIVQWSTIGTGATITLGAGQDTIRVFDTFGDTVYVWDLSTLPPCNASCDPTITAAGPFCADDAAVTLTAAQTGGTWSGTGITNGSTGEFDPATAGPGTHTITYDLGCGTDTEDITVNALDDPTFSYAQSSYCLSDPNPTPTISGTSGGTFTINNGGTINSSTGEIDITASGAGTFDITYTTSGPCPDLLTVTVTLTSGADATITAAGPFCENDAAVTLTAVDGGGTWSGTGITNGTTGEFDPATAGAGAHTITYTIAGSCGDTDTETITVNATDDPTFSYSQGSFCLTDPNPTPTISGTSGGIFTINNGGTINSSTGEVDITASGAGTFDVTYTTSGPCPDQLTVTVTLTSGADATISAAGPFCDNDAPVTLSAVDAGGTWSGTGITNGTTGEFDPATAGAGTHTITYTISGSCGDTDTETITVNATDDPTFSFAQGSYCLTDPNPTPTISGTSGGTFTINNGGTINGSTGQIDIAASGAGSYDITYTTSGSCPDQSTVTIVLTAGGDATITPAGPFCSNDAAVTLTAVDGGGTWSGAGITNSTTGEFDPATAGAGSWDVIYEIPGSCGDSDTITIVVGEAAVVSVTADQSICEGETVTLTASGTGSFLWSTGETTTSITVTPGTTTTYFVDATTSCGTAADTVMVTVSPQVVASASQDTTILIGTSADLSASGGTTYQWYPPTGLSCTTCQNPAASPAVTTTYCVDVSSGGTCIDSACVRVFVVDDCGEVFIPTAISPNGDGNNDIIQVQGNCFTNMTLQIFNRWGEKIFEATDVNDVWDGTHREKPVNSGVYVYYFTAESIVNGESIVKKGTITVIR